MSDGLEELRKLEKDFSDAPAKAYKQIDAVAAKGALNIKTRMFEEARSRLGGDSEARAFPFSITYDRATRINEIGYEIGPDKFRTQGALGNILYFGTSKNEKVLDVEVGIREEAPKFDKHMADVAEKIVRGDG